MLIALYSKSAANLTFTVALVGSLLFMYAEPIAAQVIRKSSVEFKATDGLVVSADLYTSKKTNPYILFCHQELSSRAEFDSIASRFIKMNFNCMSVDLRSGDKSGFVQNETAKRAREEGFLMTLPEARKDIEAAIEYLSGISEKKISLFGSASSASLALIVGRNNDNIGAVVAFSPGDYFAPENSLSSLLSNYPKPVFVAGTLDEYTYFSLIEDLHGHDRIIFKPSNGDGLRGSRALLKENPTRDEYWLSLLLFLKSLQ